MAAADDAIRAVAEAVGYQVGDWDGFRHAFVHRSYSAENAAASSYERLEFLGDAVLQLIITDHLYEHYTHMPEGEMAKVRASVVNEKTLAGIATEWKIGPALLLGRGEELTDGRAKPSILADVVEAIIGVIYLESGLAAAAAVVHAHWDDLIDDRASAPGRRDYKTRLQERLARVGDVPHYRVGESGPEHAKEFTAEVYGGDRLIGSGAGSSKKRAEQSAAEEALLHLDAEADAEADA